MASSQNSAPILVWGIAGASLGMEIAKSLFKAGHDRILGCDISPLAFGHFCGLFESTHVLDRASVEQSLRQLFDRCRPEFVIPGGDQVSRVIGELEHVFNSNGCRVASNNESVVKLASDKYKLMVWLESAGFTVPKTRLLENILSVDGFPLPAVLKPRFDSGGSRGVFVVSSQDELKSRVSSVLESGVPYVLQAYVSDAEGEYTIGVLSNTNQVVAGSILLKRTFQNLLSVHDRGEGYLISSGSSQGQFQYNISLQRQAEAIAAAIGSTGPLNIQGRVQSGVLLPFEINPRFSASTYLRSLSGVNEVDLYLRHLRSGEPIEYPSWVEGLAIRSFSEIFVERGKIPADVF